MEVISAFFIGMACGGVVGIFILAIAIAAGEGRKDTD